MRILPHETSDAVIWGDVAVVVDGVEGATSWDYASEVRVSTSVAVDERKFLHDTGLQSLGQTAAVLIVDCSSTGHRLIERATLGASRTSLTVDIPPGTVAKSVAVARGIVLAGNHESGWRVARRLGDRLNEADPLTITLEGGGGRFPVDAVDFASVGLPPKALWNLEFQPDGWDDLYLGVVRLRVNTGHVSSEALLQQDHPDHHPFVSVLRVDVIVQMLTGMLPFIDDLDSKDHDPDSVAGVLEGIVQTYAGLDLAHSLTRARDSLTELVSTLQSNALYLMRKT